MNGTTIHEKIGRNKPCPCGSGKKYKYCCINNHSTKFPQKKQEAPSPNFYYTPSKIDPLKDLNTAITSCSHLQNESDIFSKSFAPMLLGGFLKIVLISAKDFVITTSGNGTYSSYKQQSAFFKHVLGNNTNRETIAGIEDISILTKTGLSGTRGKSLLTLFNNSLPSGCLGELKLQDLIQILERGTFQLGKIEICRENNEYLLWGQSFNSWKQHLGTTSILKYFFHNYPGSWNANTASPIIKVNIDNLGDVFLHDFINRDVSMSQVATLEQRELLCFVCEWEGNRIALGLESSFIFLPSAANFFQLWRAQIEGNEISLLSQIESLSDTKVWRLFVGFSKLAYIDALIDEVYMEANSSVLRITKTVRASVLAKKMRLDATRKPLLLGLILALEHEDSDELRAAFITLWDACINFCCPNSTLPEGKTVLKALCPNIEVQKNSKQNRTGAPKQKHSGQSSHWRMRREDITAAELNELQIMNASRKLENHAASEIKSRELGIQRPVVIFMRGSSDREIIFNTATNEIVLPVVYLQYTWEVLCDIVEWGLAHALANEYQKSCATEAAAYEMAWRRLNLQPSYRTQRKRMSDIPLNWKENTNSGDDTEKRFLEKIDKLFALGGSSNEAEAALAMQRAQEMLASHNISRHKSGKGGQRDMVRLVLHLDSKRLDTTLSYITSILVDFYFVRVVYGWEWDVVQQIDTRCIYVLGRRENVLMAEHVFDFLTYKINSLWQEAFCAKSLPRKAKLSYQLGLLKGFRAKLDAIAVARTARTTGETEKTGEACLIHLEGIDVDNYVEAEFPKLSNMQKTGVKLHSQGFTAGMTDGADIIIHEPLKGQQTNKNAVQMLT